MKIPYAKNLQNRAKVGLTGEFIAINACIKQQERSIIACIQHTNGFSLPVQCFIKMKNTKIIITIICREIKIARFHIKIRISSPVGQPSHAVTKSYFQLLSAPRRALWRGMSAHSICPGPCLSLVFLPGPLLISLVNAASSVPTGI